MGQLQRNASRRRDGAMKEESKAGDERPPVKTAHDESASPCSVLVFAGSLLSAAVLSGCGGGAHLGQSGLPSRLGDPSLSDRRDAGTATKADGIGAFAAARAARNVPRAGSVTQSSDANGLGVTLDAIDVEINVADDQNHYAVSYNGLELASTQTGTAQVDVADAVDQPKGTIVYERVDGGVAFYRSVETLDVDFGKQGPASATWGLPPGDIWVDIHAEIEDREPGEAATVPSTDPVNAIDYLARGIWVFAPDDATRFDDYEYGAFADGSDPFVQGNLAGLTGMASYSGEDAASGVYAKRDGRTNYFFDADVSLVADFGEGLELGTVSGRIHDIEVDGLTFQGDPQILLRESTIGSAGSGFLVGNTSLTLDGRTLTGKWGAQFYDNGDADTDLPGTAAGTFGATSADGGESFLGAFAADTTDRTVIVGDLLEENSDVAELLATSVTQGKSPGLLAAVIDPDGVVAVGSAGLRRLGSTEALTVNDRVLINSNTKAMTSTMLATLVADGTFPGGWDTTIEDVFPELSETIEEDYLPVTLSQLVRMQGGIARDATNWWSYASHTDLVAQRYAILRDNLTLSPAGSAGDFLYSNLSYMVAGAMAERLTGKTWEALMEDRLFAPLGITTAGFGAPGTPGGVAQPWGHYRNADGDWVPSQYGNPQTLGPAGMVHLSIADWAKFVQLWFPSKEPPILDRDTLTALITSNSGSYAAGWQVASRSWARGRALTHSGHNFHWHTVLWIAPNTDTAYLAVANSYDSDTYALLGSIIDSLIGETWERDGDSDSGGSDVPSVAFDDDFEMLAKANQADAVDALASFVAAARSASKAASGSMVAQHGGAVPAEILSADRENDLADGARIGNFRTARQGRRGIEQKTVATLTQKDGTTVTRESYVVRYGDFGAPAENGGHGDYLSWGFWMQFDDDSGTADSVDFVTTGVFAEGTYPADFATVAEVMGTASYEGEASGLYADNHGVSYFDANASLVVDFGGQGAESILDGASGERQGAGTIWGAITDFYIDGARVQGVVFLEESAIVEDGTDGDGAAAVFSGTTSGVLAGRTLGGSAGLERDRWGGMMFRVDDAGGPDLVAGTFGASSADATVGVMGAFHAARP